MAGGNTGELWFELGVRDRVQKALDADLQKIKQLEAVLNQIGLDQSKIDKTLAKAFSSANKAAEKYRDSLHKMIEARQKLQTAYSKGLSLGADVSKTEQALNRINGYFIRLIKAANKYGADSKQVTDILNANYSHVLRTMNGVYTAQERLNNSQARQNATDMKRLADNMVSANKALSDSYDKVTQSGRQTMSTLSMLRQQMGYYFSLFGMQTLLRDVITIGGQFEFQHVALQNIIGDAEKATAIFSQLKDLAVESPKTFMELTSSAKQLSAYQIPVNELYDTTKRLSDLSVGLGVDMNRLILAYGQVRSAAVLRGQELRQFTEAGIPMVQALAQKFTEMNGKLTTTADVFKLIQTRAVSFEMVKEVLWDMTNQGGQFYNMQATMADTLYGKWQKLQDIWQITLGDMADANSWSGKFFKTALDGVILLARNLQSLIPMLGVYGFYKGTRSIKNNFFGGMTDIDRNITKAQRLTEIELRRKLLNGQIDKEMYDQAIKLNSQKSSYYELLAAEGKINDKKVAQLAIEGQINKEFAERLLLMKGYTQEQINAAMANKGAGMAGPLSGIGRGIFGFIGGWTGVATLGVGAVVSAISAYAQRMEEIDEKAKSMATNAKERAKTLKDSYDAIADKAAPTDQGELQHQVEAMKEILKNQDLYTEAIDKSVTSATSLSEKYEILKKNIKDAADAQQLMADYSELAKQAVKDSGYFLGATTDPYGNVRMESNERVDTNMTQFEASYNKYVTYVTSLGDVREKIEAEIKKIGGSLGASLNGKDLEEQIRILVQSGAWDDIVARFSDTDKDLAEHLKNVGEYADDANNKWMEIATDDIPKIVDTIKSWIPAKGEEAIRKWAQSNETIVQAMINAIARMISINAPKIRAAFVNAIRGVFGLSTVGIDGNTANEGTPYTRQSVASKNLIHKIIKAYGNGVTSVKEMAQWIGDTSNEKTYEDAFEGIKKARDAAKKTYNAAKAAKRDASKEEAEYKRLDKIFKGSGAEAYFAAQSSDKKKGGGSSGSKTDEVAKAARERVSVLKEAYSEYKKWASIIGKESALDKVKESGIFGSLFADKDFKGLGDYKGELQRIKSKLSPDKSEQRKVIESIDKILLGMDYDEAKEQAEKDIALLQSAMDKLGKAWDNYKSLYDKTGNKAFAELAFSGGTLWDKKASALAEELSKKANLGTIDFTMSEESAKDFFNYNTTKGKALFELWKQIVDLIKNNYNSALTDTADSMASLMTEEEKIAQIEQKIADLKENEKASDNDPRITKLKKEAATLQQQAFEKSGSYLKFYNSILSMTIQEAEEIGQKIRENLDKNMQKGVISAKEYVRQVKLINEQMQKLRGKQGDFSALMSGGLQGLFQNKYDKAESDFNQSVIDLQNASDMYEKAISDGSRSGAAQAQSAMDSAGAMKEGAAAAMQGAQGAMSTVAMIDKIVHGINDVVQGIKGTFDEIKEMYDALGHDTQSDSWENWNTFFDGFSKASQNATNAWDSLKNGNAGGVIQGVVGSFTSWVTAFAQGHDRKLDHQIKLAQEQINAIDRLSKSLETQLNRTLGGVYAYTQSEKTKSQFTEWSKDAKYDRDFWKQFEKVFGHPGRKQRYSDETIEGLDKALASGEYYDEQFALLLKNRDELERQLAAEEDKKKNDSEKIADYKQSIDEIGDQIEHFAEDMAKALYDIDVKSWAKELTDAVVDAWVSGEDAAQAWHDKVSDLVKDVTKNILAQKVVEGALQPVLNYITDEMTKKAGKLDESSIMGMAELLEVAGNNAVTGVTSLLEAMKAAGFDLSDAGKGASSASQVLSGLSENDQSLLMSYVNAIRGDVSVLRTLAEQESGTLTGMNATVQLQLRELETISVNTRRNADSAEFIESFCRGLRDGEYTIKVK